MLDADRRPPICDLLRRRRVLRKKLTTKAEEIGRAFDQYGTLLSLASVSVLGGAISIKPGESIRDLGKALSTVELDELKAP